MANCHELFKRFNESIRLSDEDRDLLIKARNSLRDRMQKVYLDLPQEVKKTHEIEFQSQGSFVMDTIIKPDVEDFDLDDGVYFLGSLEEEQRNNIQAFHDLIIRAIDMNYEIEKIIDKNTCVRVKYFKPFGKEKGFHIDIPIYYAERMEIPQLADTKNGWIASSPVEFIAWFEDKIKSGFEKGFLLEQKRYFEPYEKWLTDMRKKDCQLRRLVRYLKVWADTMINEMPSGIMMTILVASNYVPHERDDISLQNTLQEIEKYLTLNNCRCPRPTPLINEDLFGTFTIQEKEFFKNELHSFILSANQALEHPNNLDSCLKWKKHLGHRFPCHLAKNEVEGANVYATAPIKNANSRSALG